ncbi:hypothetical protein ACEYW6_36460 [Nostoc sp. UIC 10607]|uniref:hypothetical protein n=1 Tax=Nostoc sp. UIC 10607 TaxID=3045935 RepID=UPI00399F2F9A
MQANDGGYRRVFLGAIASRFLDNRHSHSLSPRLISIVIANSPWCDRKLKVLKLVLTPGKFTTHRFTRARTCPQKQKKKVLPV